MDLSDGPQTLTVEEAAKVLRIGRTAAYALAREWRATNGASGLPVLELGRSLRVPRHALQTMLEQSQMPVVERQGHPVERRHQRSTQRGGAAPAQARLWGESVDAQP
jgi:excisionase family DNA binding protein